jgi:glycosyltransferase involved in cell wall biosynthesis
MMRIVPPLIVGTHHPSQGVHIPDNISMSSSPQPALAIIVNANTPYRLAFHLRIAREIQNLRLHSIFTHEVSNSPWVIDAPPEINAVYFGNGESSEQASSNAVGEWKKAGRIIEYLIENRITAVVIYGYNDFGRLRIINHCHSAGIPCFLWGDSNAASDHVSGLKRRLKTIYIHHLLRKLSGIMVCGSLGKQFFVNYGASPENIHFVPYEPDYNLIQRLPAETIAAAAESFGLAPGRRRIVYSGRLAPEKRVDLLLRAFGQLAPDRPDWDLILIGDGPLAPELKDMVGPTLAGRVKFLGFQGEQSKVSAVYRNSDVLCLPSQYEPWALVVNEAAAAGLAIVTSDVVGASAELVRDGINGKVFKNKDLDGLTASLRFVTDPARIDALRAGSAAVLADWRTRGDPIKGLVQALSANRKSL